MSDQPVEDDLDRLLKNGPTRWMYSVHTFHNGDLAVQLNNLGRIGWEVVSMTLTDSTDCSFRDETRIRPTIWQVVMKRPWTWALEK